MSESSSPMAPAAFSHPGHGGNADIGVAICHGFTGSPLSVVPWAAHPAARGYAVSHTGPSIVPPGLPASVRSGVPTGPRQPSTTEQL